jgi:hypothetical protein
MENIIQQIIDNFDWAYMLSVNVLTYIIVQLYKNITKKKLTKLAKQLILIGSTIVLAICYKQLEDVSLRILLNSAILAPIAWDFVFRPIADKLGIGYEGKKVKQQSTPHKEVDE